MNTCAVRVVTSAAYGILEVVHHGEVTSCSLEYAYYTGNAGFPQNKLVAINQNGASHAG